MVNTKLHCLILWLSSLLTGAALLSPVFAQQGYPLPDTVPITPANAAQVEQLARLGSAQPGELAWSPDGVTLAVGTSAGVYLYNTDTPNQPPRFISGGNTDVAFNGAGDVLVSGGWLWNAATGEALMEVGNTAAYARRFSPRGSILVTTTTDQGEVVVHLWGVTSVTGVAHRATLQTGSYLNYSHVVFSPDEHFAVITFEDPSPFGGYPPAQVQLWDVVTANQVATLPQMREWMTSVTFSSDSRLLLTANGGVTSEEDSTDQITIWDGRTGQPLFNDTGLSPRLSPDGLWLAYDTLYGNAQLYSLEGVREPVNLTYDGVGRLTSPVFSPNGSILAVVAQYTVPASTESVCCDVLLWDIAATHIAVAPRAILRGNSSISNMMFSPDSSLLLATDVTTTRIWNVETGEEHLVLQDIGSPTSFSSDNSMLMTINEGERHIWDVVAGQHIFSIPFGAQLNPNWSRIAYLRDGSAFLLDTLQRSEFELQVLDDYLGYLAGLNTVSAKTAFAHGNALQVNDLLSGQPIISLSTHSLRRPYPLITFSLDGTWLLVDDTVLDTTASEMVATRLELPPALDDALFSPDGSLLAMANLGPAIVEPGTEQLWDVQSGTLLAEWQPNPYGASSHAFTPDRRLLSTGDFDEGYVRLWDIHATIAKTPNAEASLSDGVLRVAIRFQTGTSISAVFSPNGSKLAVGLGSLTTPAGGTPQYPLIYLFTLADVLAHRGYVPIQQLEHIRLTDALLPLFSPDSTLLLTRDTYADILRLWNPDTGEQLASLPGDGIAAFSPDSTLLVVHTADGIALWNVAALLNGARSPLTTLHEENKDVRELAFNPDGTLLFVRSSYAVSVWGVPSGE